MRVIVRAALAGILVSVACGSPAVKTAGQSCVSSAECGEGLLCNLDSHVCAPNGGAVTIDAAVNAFMHPLIDGSGGKPPVDAKPIDAPGSGSGSGSDAAVPDAM
jgi:hypothetical protein